VRRERRKRGRKQLLQERRARGVAARAVQLRVQVVQQHGAAREAVLGLAARPPCAGQVAAAGLQGCSLGAAPAHGALPCRRMKNEK